jgi:predicted MFS family arabinose efflux permease
MFWLGVPLALVGTALMYAVLPDAKPVSTMPYGRALKSLWMYWKKHKVLRVATITQASLFASFSTFWTILALYLNGPRFHMGADAAGLFGIVGAVGIFAAPIAGRIADARGPRIIVVVGSTCVLLAWIAFGAFPSLTALVVGVVILDFGMQSALISNQQTVFGLDPEARSRLNTIFMTGMFIGGALGSAMATFAWLHGGWRAVSVLGGLLAVFALAVNITSRRA